MHDLDWIKYINREVGGVETDRFAKPEPQNAKEELFNSDLDPVYSDKSPLTPYGEVMRILEQEAHLITEVAPGVYLVSTYKPKQEV